MTSFLLFSGPKTTTKAIKGGFVHPPTKASSAQLKPFVIVGRHHLHRIVVGGVGLNNRFAGFFAPPTAPTSWERMKVRFRGRKSASPRPTWPETTPTTVTPESAIPLATICSPDQ